MLFFLTLIVTFPSLYVFNALVGSRLSFRTVLRLLIAALGVMLAVLASFGTIVVFFSLCTTSYPFMVLLNVAMFAVAGILGMGFLLQTLHRLSLAQAMRSADEAATAALAARAPLRCRTARLWPPRRRPPLPRCRRRARPPPPAGGRAARADGLPHLGARLRTGRRPDGVGAAAVHRRTPTCRSPSSASARATSSRRVYNKIVDVAAGEGTETSERQGNWNRRGGTGPASYPQTGPQSPATQP